ncbi:ACT domain-containing protein [Taylorella equigenitalis]|nr:ACT domain-containing protein [Taylorella equigenitalis]
MNSKGVLGSIALEASKHDSNISNLSMIDEDSDSANINITLQLEDLAQLRAIMSDIRRIPEVMSVTRPNLTQSSD